MIKLLHLADLHIGVENYGRLDPVSGLHTRLKDYLDRLDEAMSFGMDEGVHLVIIAGDIYKNRLPNPTHQREFARRIGRLREAGIPVFMITGNHDISPAAGRAHSVEIFQALAVQGVMVAHKPRIECIETRAGRVQIIAVPWVSRQALLTRDETQGLTISEIDSLLRQKMNAFIERSIRELDPTIPAVLTLHGTIDGATFGAERAITLGQDLVFARSLVAQPVLDYVALGHIHRHQSLGEHPPIVYPGSIERIDFGEKDEDKGCVLVELAKGATRWHFKKLDARPFISIEVDVRLSSNPEERIAVAISRHDVQRAVVRVDVRATREQAAALRSEDIRQQLEDAHAFFIAAINIEAERETRTRLGSADEGFDLLRELTPRKALELYLKSKDTPPDRIAALLAAADELLTDE
ncbi:MAG: exonuclease SbcCD subunit D [Chloroflexaceae bacterium]|nr:exonuclease SbcCD subunit D [Chloroflexaceae bacterium]